MSGVRPDIAFLIGLMIGAAIYGPSRRWILGLRGAIRGLRADPDRQRRHTLKLLFIFVTMHPVPWLILIGVPFAAYRILVDPRRMMWLSLSGGVTLAIIAWAAYDAWVAAQSRRSSGARGPGVGSHPECRAPLIARRSMRRCNRAMRQEHPA